MSLNTGPVAHLSSTVLLLLVPLHIYHLLSYYYWSHCTFIIYRLTTTGPHCTVIIYYLTTTGPIAHLSSIILLLLGPIAHLSSTVLLMSTIAHLSITALILNSIAHFSSTVLFLKVKVKPCLFKFYTIVIVRKIEG